MNTDVILTVGRDVEAVKCDCGGYAERVDCTPDEVRSEYNCGRSHECCCRAFVCCVCKKRILRKAEAPEME